MKLLAREIRKFFNGSVEDNEKLRLAPQPLQHYQPERDDVIDGALFAWLSGEAGTDPEVLVLLEAHRPAPKLEPMWHVGVARLSARDLEVRRGLVVHFASLDAPSLRCQIAPDWSLLRNGDDTFFMTPARRIDWPPPSASP